MLLTVDISNAVISCAVFKETKLIADFALTNQHLQCSDEYGLKLINMLQLYRLEPQAIKGAIIASVVPKTTDAFKQAISRFLKIEALVVGPGLKSIIKIHYGNPKEIGSDRIAVCAGAHILYGGDLLVIDFSTATTFELIDAEGVYQGGCIAPGIALQAEALSNNTSKLPTIELKATTRVLTSDTVSAMQAGIYWGTVGMTSYLIKRFKKEHPQPLRVIATGSYSALLINDLKEIDFFVPNLVHEGLRLIYQRNRLNS